MCFSNDGAAFSAWEPFSPTANWSLPSGAGKKTVFVKVRDRAGNEATASAVVEYAPALTVGGPPVALAAAVMLVIACAMSAFVIGRRLKKRSAGR
jgi:hypothetical protein